MSDSYYIVIAKYPMQRGTAIVDMDKRLRNIVGDKSCDSGAGFGERDLLWYFEPSERDIAYAAADRLRGVDGVKVDVKYRGEGDPLN